MQNAMELAGLYRDVYEHPADDGRRKVLADALLDVGDPRGELIALQYQANALARKRANKLIGRYREHLLGPLARVIFEGSEQFERGFLVGCTARLIGDTVGCAEWATVQRLELVGAGAWAPTELGSPHMRSLREVRLTAADDNWWRRQHELELLRRHAERELSSVNRLALLKV